MLTQPEMLQREFDVLVGLFDWVDLRTSMQKTVRMACHPCHTPFRMLVVAYKMQKVGTSPTYWERQMMQVQCME